MNFEQLQDECTAIGEKLLPLQSDEPELSIVFPDYNEGTKVLGLLQSLIQLKLSEVAIEIIGVDNNSTDDTFEILEQCGVKVIEEKKKGVSYARQAGIENAQGNIILQTDADSKVPSEWVDAHVWHYQVSPHLVGVIGNIGFESVCFPIQIREQIRAFRRKFDMNFRLGYIVGANMSYLRESVNEIGGFEGGTNLFEDRLLVMKLRERFGMDALSTDFSKENRVLTDGRRYGNSWNAFRNMGKSIFQHLKIDYMSGNSSQIPTGLDFSDIR
jgi:glycosyltransferase involved in cell wall biosynthesis